MTVCSTRRRITVIYTLSIFRYGTTSCSKSIQASLRNDNLQRSTSISKLSRLVLRAHARAAAFFLWPSLDAVVGVRPFVRRQMQPAR